MQQTPPEVATGSSGQLGRYHIVGRLGDTALGRVLAATDPSGRRVAVTILAPEVAASPGFRERFAHEVRVVAAAPAWFVAALLDAEPDADPPWFVEALVDGPSLAVYVAENGPLGPAGVEALASRLAAGLVALHAVGVAHEGLAPATVLLAEEGPRLVGMGAARLAGGEGPAGDMRAFGYLLCFAATGKDGIDLTALTGPVREVVAACLSGDPARRPTAAQAASALPAAEDPAAPPVSTALVPLGAPAPRVPSTSELAPTPPAGGDAVPADAVIGPWAVASTPPLGTHSVNGHRGGQPGVAAVPPVRPTGVDDATVIAPTPWVDAPVIPPPRQAPGSPVTLVGPAWSSGANGPPPASPWNAGPGGSSWTGDTVGGRTVAAPPGYPVPPSRRRPWPLVAAVAAVALLLAAGLAYAIARGISGRTGQPSATSSASAGPASGPGGPAAGTVAIDPASLGTTPRFRSPTRNIACAMTGTPGGVDGGARCDVTNRTWTQLPPQPSSCTSVWGHGAQVRSAEPGSLTCAADSLADSSPTPLQYGQSVTFASVVCVSRDSGIRCTNTASGHGFRVARSSYELF